MNEDAFPIGKKVDFQPAMLVYWRVIPWVFPKIGVSQNGWFIIENPIKMDELVGFPICFGNIHISWLVNLPPPNVPPQK